MDVLFGDGEDHVLLNIGTNLAFAGFSSRADPYFDVFRRATFDGIMPLLESAILVVFALKQGEQEAVPSVLSNRLIHGDFVVKHRVWLKLPRRRHPGVSLEVKVEAFSGAIEGNISISERLAGDLEYGVKPGIAKVLEVPTDPFHLPPVVGAFLAHLNDTFFPIPSLWELGEGRLNARTEVRH